MSAEQSACSGKVSFASRALARVAAARKTQRMIYKCEHCKAWHVGKTNDRKRRMTPYHRY